jgi:hypothetical protein
VDGKMDVWMDGRTYRITHVYTDRRENMKDQGWRDKKEKHKEERKKIIYKEYRKRKH